MMKVVRKENIRRKNLPRDDNDDDDMRIIQHDVKMSSIHVKEVVERMEEKGEHRRDRLLTL